MTTTTKKTKTPAEISRQRHADARQTLTDRQGELAAVLEEIATVNGDWTAGRDDVPASRMTELKEDERRLTLLISAAERAYQTTKRNLLTDNPELAEAVALVLNGVHHGIEAEGVTVLPSHDPDDLLPRVYVVQRKPHRDTGDGTVIGDCTVHLVGPAWTKPLDPSAIERVFKEAQVLPLGGLVSSGNEISLTEVHAHPWVPTIVETLAPGDSVNVSDWAHLIEKQTITPLGFSLAFASGPQAQVTQTSVAADGTRTVVVKAGLTVYNNSRDGYWSADQAVEQSKKLISGQIGRTLGSVGRITQVEHLLVTPTEPTLFGPGGRRLTIEVTATSKVKAD